MTESAYRLLVIVPVYNHHQHLAQILETVNRFQLPCLFVDDGSNSVTQETLAQCVSNPSNAPCQNTRLRFEYNRGKGAVVCDGLRWARQHGYTHALQIDADGQHDLNDIPAFIAASQAHPDAVISGYRDYAAMPPQRRYGRMLTDFWAIIHTWSHNLRDSMCGYRLYPLAATTALIDHHQPGQRMNFDTDILVRLYWRGLDVHHVPTAIRYHHDIPSHFDPWRDNLRITAMHTRLFFGMLGHIPSLLRRTWQ